MKTSRIAFLAAVLAASTAAPSVFADCTTPVTHTVSSPNDDGGTGTLRFLINSASTKDCDTIEIPPMLIVLDGATGQIELKKSITIRGAGADSTIIDANGGVSNDRAFEIDPDDTGVGIEMSGLTIRNGNSGSQGGAILVSNHGTLILSDSEVTGNTAATEGGGIAVPSEGGLTVEASVISDNEAVGSYGGGVYISDGSGSTGLISGSTIDGNKAQGGGGLYVDYTSLEVINSKITNNTTQGNYGGGIWNEAGSVYIYDSEISGNLADGQPGGGIRNDYTMLIDNCDIKNNRATSSSGDGGGIENNDGGHLTIMNSTIDGNKADDQGGGIYHYYYGLTVLNCTISNNVSDADSDGSGGGGGLWASDSGYSTHISGSLIIGNTSNGSDGGGGIQQYGYAVIDDCTIANNTAVNGWGGGIYADNDPTVIRNTTISGNRAVGDDGSDDSSGGGIYTAYPLLIVNSTIANNEADGDGGGLYEDGEGSTLNNVTVTGNVADANEGGLSGGDGGGIFNNNEVALSNSIVAGNIDKSAGNEAPDCFNDFTGSTTGLKLTGPTLIQDTNGCEIQGDPRLLINADPLLDGGLADNGGRAQGDTPTQNEQTIKLADGSPAIDAGDNGSCETTDENGVARPAGDNCDLGAVENTVAGGTTTGGDTTGGDTTGGTTTGGSSDSGGCSLIR